MKTKMTKTVEQLQEELYAARDTAIIANNAYRAARTISDAARDDVRAAERSVRKALKRIMEARKP